jgi:hypothetical protein
MTDPVPVPRELLARLLGHAIEQRDQYRADQLHTLADLAETDMEKARALLSEPGMGGWKPIDSAPRDGTAVLVMRDIWPGTKSGHAEECNGHNTYVAMWWGNENDGAGAWVCYMDAVCDPHCPIEPTHWMPLPEPPPREP